MLIGTDICEEIVRIQGTHRTLEGILAYPFGEPSCCALIAGPHPFLGGDRRNNVVSAVLESLAGAGAVTLAYDYSGVGTREGTTADWSTAMSAFWRDGSCDLESDWVDDTGCALKALGDWCHLPRVLVGYSFGCWALVRNLPGADARAIVLISPNVKQHAFDELGQCPGPVLVIHSPNDFTCTVDQVTEWVDALPEPKTRLLLTAGEHFFRGHEEEVAGAVVTYLRQQRLLPAGQHE